MASKEKLNTLIEEVKSAVLEEVLAEVEKMFEEFANSDFSDLRSNLLGDKGAQGEVGLQGIQGIKGDLGPQGPKGDTGPKGEKGDFVVGAQGPKGEKGDAGVGSPDTGEQIVGKINALEAIEGKQIDASHIKNLISLIKKHSEGAIRLGGGGITLETPTGTVNGVNTIFDVTMSPKYLIVDGMSKFQDVHYTLAGSRITITDGAPPVTFIRAIV